MQQERPVVNTIALLTNVALVMAALERTMNAPRHLSRQIALYGPSGWGKTKAATYAANKFRAYHVRCTDVMTRKSFLKSILNEMAILPAPTIPEMLDQVNEELTTSQRPLFIDEIDHMVRKASIEIIRDIHDLSACSAILLIGEEKLPTELAKWERVHRRVHEWVLAQPADIEDARQLRSLYVSPGLSICDELLNDMVVVANGSVGRITENLALVEGEAITNGWTTVDRATWGNRPFYAGRAPKRQGGR
jgi:DNA transposition AAA+ family ATPase